MTDQPTRLRLHLDTDPPRDVEITDLPPDLSVGRLALLVGLSEGPTPPSTVAVDGTEVPGHLPWRDADLVDGTRLSSTPDHPVTAEHRPAMDLLQVAGPSAGGRIGLTPGGYTLGISHHDATTLTRGGHEQVDITAHVSGRGEVVVSAPSGRATVEGEPLVRPRTLDGGVVDVDGTAQFRIVPALPPRPRRIGEVHRPPRRAVIDPDTTLDLPTPPSPPAAPQKLSWIMMVAPLPVAILMAFILNPYFMVFAAMGPVVAFARWVDGRRTFRQETAEHEEAMDAFRATVSARLDRARRVQTAHLRDVHPDPPAIVARAGGLTTDLWDRRPSHARFAVVPAASGPRSWAPDTGDVDLASLGLEAVLPAVPLTVDLTEPVGVVGPRAHRLAVARHLLLSMCTLSGPADVEVAIVTEPGGLDDWQWSKWLPHLGAPARATDDPDTAVRLLDDWLAPARDDEQRPPGVVRPGRDRTDDDILRLVVVDGPSPLREGSGTLRAALAPDPDGRRRATGIVLADRVDALPASCSAVIDTTPGTRDVVVDMRRGSAHRGAVPMGIPTDLAETAGRALAGRSDPEIHHDGSGIPDTVALLDLLGDARPGQLAARWQAAGDDPDPAAVVGVTSTGPLEIDLAADGPHGLLAGTTGSGKSELLRTLVAALAAHNPPDTLNFLLVDYKGGGAFDACARLPHTSGVVTDLDGHLAARALQSLHAEVRHREERLRAADASDLLAYRATGGEPLPRLLVVVDEFATLAAELPDFLDSLVDIAQRGRSLGVHLLLATQRPAGVLDAKIRANTNLRIALRVQDDNDALDVVGTAEPARLPRTTAGRGHVRFGAGDVIEFQAAYVSGHSRTGDVTRTPSARPFGLVDWSVAAPTDEPDEPTTPADGAPADGRAGSDLEWLVDNLTTAAADVGLRPARQVWLPPLPLHLDAEQVLAESPHRPGSAPIGRIDRPEEQRRELAWFDHDAGHLLVYGAEPDVTGATLATVALAMAHRHDPDHLHLYVMDLPDRSLRALSGLAHAGGYVTTDDVDLVGRLLDTLEAEVARRRAAIAEHAGGEPPPRVVVVAHGLGAQFEAAAAEGDHDLINRISQLMRAGPQLGIVVIASAAHDRGLPLRLTSMIAEKLLHRFADPASYLTFGLKPADVPDLTGARAVTATTGHDLVLARFAGGDLTRAVDAVEPAAATTRPPPPVQTLSGPVIFADVAGHGHVDGQRLALPVGIDVDGLQPALLQVEDRVLVAGSPGSGRTSVLVTLLAGLAQVHERAGTPPPPVVVVGGGRLADAHEDHVRAVESHRVDTEDLAPGTVLVIDDADELPDEAVDRLSPLVKRPPTGVSLIVAARRETVIEAMSWLRPMRSARSAVILQPQPTHGDVVRILLPLRGPQRHPPGRAMVVTGGVPDLVQLALPPDEPTSATTAPRATRTV